MWNWRTGRARRARFETELVPHLGALYRFALHMAADRGAPLELASSDVAIVNAWLRERLSFPAAVGVPGSPAITLAGASTVTLGGHPAGLVRYRMDGRDVSLFLLAEPAWSDDTAPVRVGAMAFRLFRRRGVDVVAWTHAPLSYLLISADGLPTGAACGACHGDDSRHAIADFVAAVAGRASDT